MTPAAGNPDSFTFAQSGGSVTESAASVGAGNTDTFTLVVFAPAGLANGATFSDTASASSCSPDPNPANDSATVTGSVVNTAPTADLAVADSGPATAAEGGNITYTITVTNKGPDPATGAVLTDTLGANLRFVAATTSQGTFTQSGGVVTFNLGSIPTSGTVTATITAQALEDGNLTNSASVTSSSADPTSAGSSATATTAVAEPGIVVSAPITTTAKSPSNLTVATFTHAGGVEPVSAFTAIIHWGDGKTSTGTITLSGTTYHVVGSHRYSGSGTHTITTTVTEVGNAPELLLAKIGDQVPDLPAHLGSSHPAGRLSLNAQANQPAEMIAAFAQAANHQPTPPAAGGNGTSGGVTRQAPATSPGALLGGGNQEGRAPGLAALLRGLRAQAPSIPTALHALYLLGDQSSFDLGD
jgi:uncharacterized repeat protein (TIGR01451 family)